MLGVAVTSSSPCVAARCAHARAGVGAAASQNVTDPRLGPTLLDLMAEGRTAPEAIAEVGRAAEHVEYRQLTAIDAAGRTAARSGAHTLGRHGTAEGRDCLAAGNLLANDGVPGAMVAAFARDPAAALGRRLAEALLAGRDAGGEEGPVRSAGLLVVDRVAWPVADLRVDWHDEPLEELARLWDVWAPQLDDYVTRALDPTAAPSFGVPGDP
jgi:uncharacterized Ntn-hydrolase superfamily protein